MRKHAARDAPSPIDIQPNTKGRQPSKIDFSVAAFEVLNFGLFIRRPAQFLALSGQKHAASKNRLFDGLT